MKDKGFLTRAKFALLLLLVQALLFNHIAFSGYGTPMVCIYPLLISSLLTPRYSLLLAGFAIGVVQDMFQGTPGHNAAALTLCALLQPHVLKLFASGDFRSDETGPEPGVATLGWRTFMLYSLCLVFVQQTAFYLLQYFSFARPSELALHIALGTLCSWACCLAIEGVRRPNKKQ